MFRLFRCATFFVAATAAAWMNAFKSRAWPGAFGNRASRSNSTRQINPCISIAGAVRMVAFHSPARALI